VLILPGPNFEPRPTTYAEYDWRFRVNFDIHRPVRLETLSSLLRYPIKWECLPPSEHHPITSIGYINLESNGALVEEIPPKITGIRNTLPRFWVDTRQCTQTEKIAETLREMVRLVPTSRGPTFARPIFGMDVKSEPNLVICLASVSFTQQVETKMTYVSSTASGQKLPEIGRRVPYASIEIDIDNSESILTLAESQERCMLATVSYGRMWKAIRSQIDFPARTARSNSIQLFSMSCFPISTPNGSELLDGELEVKWQVEFEATSSTDSFHIRMFEVEEEGGEGIVFFEQQYMVEGVITEE
jgi:hypothetical protein